MIIAIENEKGGVGKTTTTVNLAAALALTTAGRGRVLVVDLDPQHDATSMLGVPKSAESVFDALVNPESVSLASVIRHSAVEGVDVAPGHRALAGLESALHSVMGREHLLAELLTPLRSDYDYILLDNPPSLGIAPAMSLGAADVVLIPLQCDPLAAKGLRQLTETIEVARRRLNPRLMRRIVLTFVDHRMGHTRPLIEKVRGEFGAEVFAAEIGATAELKKGAMNPGLGGAAVHYAPKSPAAEWYTQLAEEVRLIGGGLDG